MTSTLLINLVLCLLALGGLAATVRLALAVSDAPTGGQEVPLRPSVGSAVARRTAVDDGDTATSQAA